MREDKERQRQRKEDGETKIEERGWRDKDRGKRVERHKWKEEDWEAQTEGGTDRGKRMERHRGKGMERRI